MIPCTIVGLSQEFNFANKTQDTFAVFELSNGQRFRAGVPEEVAQVLVQLAIDPNMEARIPDSAPPPARNGPFSNGTAPDGTQAMVFGGDIVEKLDESDLINSIEGKMNGNKPVDVAVKPRFVGKNEFGYPLLDSPGGVDPSSATGSLGEGDEDGVRSI
jgi:hypothetical protein